jgi:hypothetical protein
MDGTGGCHVGHPVGTQESGRCRNNHCGDGHDSPGSLEISSQRRCRIHGAGGHLLVLPTPGQAHTHPTPRTMGTKTNSGGRRRVTSAAGKRPSVMSIRKSKTQRRVKSVKTQKHSPVSSSSIDIPQPLIIAVIGCLYPMSYALIAQHIFDENRNFTAWKIHTTTGFSIHDCSAVCNSMCAAGFVHRIYNPHTSACVCATSVYSPVSHVTLWSGETPPPTSRSKSTLVSTLDQLIPWITAHTNIHMTPCLTR